MGVYESLSRKQRRKFVEKEMVRRISQSRRCSYAVAKHILVCMCGKKRKKFREKIRKEVSAYGMAVA